MERWETPELESLGSFEELTQQVKDFGFNDGVIFAPTGTNIGAVQVS